MPFVSGEEVEGGAVSVRVRLTEAPFDPWAEVAEAERARGAAHGAAAVFVGTMRDRNEGVAVESMFLEHYPGMTEREMARAARAALERWRAAEVVVVHRVGEVHPGEALVLVAVWSEHRAQAFEACREIMEMVKHRVPLWKRERRADGERWVERNTPGRVDPAGA